MSESCDKKCQECEEDCDERNDFREAPHELSDIKKVIGVVSGKGGVGKSLVTSLLAVSTRRNGFETGILDADITGPSIPQAFGIHQRADGDNYGLFPVKTSTGIDIISVNLLLENDTDPVIWRGPIIAGTVKQFWTDVIWGSKDFLFIDMPPGTGDVPLTIFQSLPLDGIIIVTSPQELVSMVVAKAVNMAKKMDIPILGLIENMSYAKCPDCDKKIYVFGESRLEETADQHGLPILGRLPIDPLLSSLCDRGQIELCEDDLLSEAVLKVQNLLD